MAACPVSVSPSPSRRRRLVLTQRRLEANRRNARRSTGPRTRQGKARVASNAIKHGFFAAIDRWSSDQQRNFADIFIGLCDDFRPTSAIEEALVASVAESYVRMGGVLRYESIAAYEHHQQREREFDTRIAAASPTEAARLHEHREALRRGGLWGPTIPREPDANTVMLLGRLERDISHATSRLRELKDQRSYGISLLEELKKQTHCDGEATTISNNREDEKTNPLSSTFPGNRHERRRAKALLRRRT